MLLAWVLALPAWAADNQGHVQLTPERVLGQSAIPVYGFRILHTFPHDRGSYTEGLELEDGVVYESTGLYGQSKLLKWDLQSGHVLQKVDLGPGYFGEGLTALDRRIYQLTYLANTGFIYDQPTMQRTGGFRYISQGWGLTNDRMRIMMSDGSSAILFVDPKSFEVTGRIFVSDDAGPVGFLNELEYAAGKLYANVWQTNFIAIIAPETGKVIGWIDLTGLNPDPGHLVFPCVLNGIAHDRKTGHLLVTGKCWPHAYEIELVERPKP